MKIIIRSISASRRTVLSYSLVVISSFYLTAQTSSNLDIVDSESFVKEIGGPEKLRGVTVEQTHDGGYIITGNSYEGEGDEDVVLIKSDAKGHVVWKKMFGGKGIDNGWAVRQTNDKGYIIVGSTGSFGSGGMDVLLMKTTSFGDTIWTKTFGGAGDEFGWDVRITKDDGYIIAAQTNSLGNGKLDAYLIKTDSDGNEIWSNTYGGVEVDRVFSVQETADGNYIAAGITYSYSSISSDDRDGYLVKVDATGNQMWFKSLGEDKYDVAHSVALTRDGGFIVVGYGESWAEYGKRDLYLIKTDHLGNTEWVKIHGSTQEDRGIKGEQTRDGGFIAVGFTEEGLDVYLIRTDPKGELLWTRTFGVKDQVDFGYTVKETRDGGFVLTGHTENLDGSQRKMLLIKTDENGQVSKRK